MAWQTNILLRHDDDGTNTVNVTVFGPDVAECGQGLEQAMNDIFGQVDRRVLETPYAGTADRKDRLGNPDPRKDTRASVRFSFQTRPTSAAA